MKKYTIPSISISVFNIENICTASGGFKNTKLDSNSDVTIDNIRNSSAILDYNKIIF